MIVKDKSHPPKLITAAPPSSGALIFRTDEQKGLQIIPIAAIFDIELGADHLQKKYGVFAGHANLHYKDKEGLSHFARTDIHRFLKAYNKALKSQLVDCAAFTRPIKRYIPQELHVAGDLIEGQGIYAGYWRPHHKNAPLPIIFDIYAAPADLPDNKGKRLCATFSEAATALSQIKNFHGYDGSKIRAKSDIVQAIENAEFAELEKWFIPPREILFGLDEYDKRLFKNPFLNMLEVGAYKGSFNINECYWSSTTPLHSGDIHGVNFKENRSGKDEKHKYKFAVRPVRAVLRPRS
jgi:hypothetical protein